jgi:hypothetical protein
MKKPVINIPESVLSSHERKSKRIVRIKLALEGLQDDSPKVKELLDELAFLIGGPKKTGTSVRVKSAGGR